MAEPKLAEILDRFQVENELYLISAQSRTFGGVQGGEADYVKQFQVGDDYVAAEIRGLRHMLAAVDADRSGPALEIGCGTGIFSRALVHSGAFDECLITDASSEFVRLTRAFVSRPFPGEPPAPEGRARYGLLLEDGLDILPSGAFSLVALRYVLHHILDWEAFIGQTARLLRPGGVLTFEEPCVDGFLMQAMLVSALPALMAPDGAVVGDAQRHGPMAAVRRFARALGVRRDASAANESAIEEQAKRFVDTIAFYARRDVDKSAAEDKHLFRPAEVIAAGRRHGLQVEFFPNAGYDTLGAQPLDFEVEFIHNLRTNFGFGEPIVEAVRSHLAPQLALLRHLGPGGGQPVTKGVFACRR